MSDRGSQPSKAELRRQLLDAARQVPVPEKTHRSALIQRHLLALKVVTEASGIALYRAISGEVTIGPLFDPLLEKGIRTYLPRVDGPEQMRFCAWKPGDPLAALTMGVRQPDPQQPSASPGEIQVFLVPGIAFDREGFRLGRGAGYYDRTLPRFRDKACFIGVCFSSQLVEWLPRDPWDTTMDYIVTEDGIHVVRQDSTSSR